MTKSGATAQQRVVIEVCLDAGVPFFWRGSGTLLINKPDLADILPEIVAAGEVILGFEGFELDGSDVHPRLDLVVDMELGSNATNPLLAIANWPAAVWVDVALKGNGDAGRR